MKLKRRYAILFLTAFVGGCSSVPPEFHAAMDSEFKGLNLVHMRHQQSVRDLVENWHRERIQLLNFIKQLQIEGISAVIPDPSGGADIEVVQKDALLVLERQYEKAINDANSVRVKLRDGYLDDENWSKLKKLHSVNLDMAKSLLDLNKAQKSFYQSVAGENTPYPTDFINQATKDLLDLIPINAK